MERTSISLRISELKTQFNLSNEGLAEIAGVSGQTIADIENSKTANPKMNIIVNLADKLGISPNWFVLGEGEMQFKPGTTNKLTGNNNSGNQWQGHTLSYSAGESGELKLAKQEIESLKREIGRLEKYIERLERQLDKD